MKKYITLAVVFAVSLQVVKKQSPVIVNPEPARPVVNYYLHDAVRLILKKITRLDIIA